MAKERRTGLAQGISLNPNPDRILDMASLSISHAALDIRVSLSYAETRPR